MSSIGFIRLVWFISIGYGYAIAAMATVLGVVTASVQSWQLAIQLALLFIYGVRLGTHVLRRDRNAAYRKAARENYGEPGGGVVLKTVIWVSVALLYVAMISPAVFHALDRGPLPAWSLGGLGVMVLGLALEWIADRQKGAAKKVEPERFCDRQLFAWVRCPSYLGEILFWIGNWCAGAATLTAWWHWAISLAGLLCIILIMLGSTKRLEASQRRRYGHLPEFERYSESVPILFPWVSIYSLRGWRWTLG
ncbi:MAG: DUF1295 domain-containing protein [Verrucomicrobiales bacterium]